MYVLIVYVIISGASQIFSIQGQFGLQECNARAEKTVPEARQMHPGVAVTYQCLKMAGG